MVMYNIIRGLPQHQHLVVCPTSWGNRLIGLPKMFKEAGIQIDLLPSGHQNVVMRGVEQKVLEFDPDIILNHWWRSSRIQRLNKFGKTRKVYEKAKTILVSHNNDIVPNSYDYYVSVSKHNAQFQKYTNKERKKGYINHRVIYNGIDIERFDVLKQPIEGKFVIGRVSALPKFKIPKDWVSFAKTFNIPNQLHMIVGEGERRGHLLREIRRLGVDDKFSLPGEIINEKLPEVLAKFDIFCYVTEKSEAFSLAILEASAAGLPIVTQNMGGNSEQIIHGRTGFLTSSRREIQYYCELLSKNKQLCLEMGKAAKERARQFTIEKMAREYNQLFKELLKRE